MDSVKRMRVLLFLGENVMHAIPDATGVPGREVMTATLTHKRMLKSA